MTQTYRSHSGYFEKAFSDLDEIANRMLDKVQNVEFDTIVGTGLSGTLVVPTLGRAFGTLWAIVRKESSCHTNCLIEGEIGQRWLFVDDFIASGTTLRRVKNIVYDLKYYDINIGGLTQFPTKYAGSYLYELNYYTP
jgi:adenine/guanine phosphoribosyltransferase-like PRPP-binding protein